VDYAGLAKSEAFKRYLQKAAELQRVDLGHLTREEKVRLDLCECRPTMILNRSLAFIGDVSLAAGLLYQRIQRHGYDDT
jgi:hypothetical protein